MRSSDELNLSKIDDKKPNEGATCFLLLAKKDEHGHERAKQNYTAPYFNEVSCVELVQKFNRDASSDDYVLHLIDANQKKNHIECKSRGIIMELKYSKGLFSWIRGGYDGSGLLGKGIELKTEITADTVVSFYDGISHIYKLKQLNTLAAYNEVVTAFFSPADKHKVPFELTQPWQKDIFSQNYKRAALQCLEKELGAAKTENAIKALFKTVTAENGILRLHRSGLYAAVEGEFGDTASYKQALTSLVKKVLDTKLTYSTDFLTELRDKFSCSQSSMFFWRKSAADNNLLSRLDEKIGSNKKSTPPAPALPPPIR